MINVQSVQITYWLVHKSKYSLSKRFSIINGLYIETVHPPKGSCFYDCVIILPICDPVNIKESPVLVCNYLSISSWLHSVLFCRLKCVLAITINISWLVGYYGKNDFLWSFTFWPHSMDILRHLPGLLLPNIHLLCSAPPSYTWSSWGRYYCPRTYCCALMCWW